MSGVCTDLHPSLSLLSLEAAYDDADRVLTNSDLLSATTALEQSRALMLRAQALQAGSKYA